MNKLLLFIAVIVGIVLLIIGGMYFVEPAKSLPAFFPGHDHTMTKHYKHGIGAIILGLGCFAFAWFQSGKKSSPQKEQGNRPSEE
jgi:hypothetical protein